MTADMELIREYAERNSEQAFATLVREHIDMVYSVALRHVRNHHQAEEVTQAVFIILARKAGSLHRDTVLSGWLFHTARLTAANYLRSEMRRVHREQEAFMQSNLEQTGTDSWQQIAPLLNDAIDDLGGKDRDAIVLRFVNGKNYQEVGAALGTTENAAQVRVSRAVEKLRKTFSRRGVLLSGGTLTGIIAAHSVQAAPAGLTLSVTAAALKGTAVAASTLTVVKGTLNIMAWTKTNFAVGLGLVTLIVYQGYHHSVQARQVASAQTRLQDVQAAITAQEVAIHAAQQQNLAFVEEQSAAALELEQLRARQKAAYDAIKAAAGSTDGGMPSSLLAATLSNPDAREYLHQQMVDRFKWRYADVTNEWKLSPEDFERIYQVGGDWALKNLDAVVAMKEGKITPAAAFQIQTASAAAAFSEIRSFLGDQGLEQFQDYTASFPARTLTKQIQNQLGDTLSAEQRSRLLEVLKAEPYDNTSALAGDYDVQSLSSRADLDKRYQRQADTLQRILQQAAAFLTPDQLQALETMQTNNMNRQRAETMRTVGKF